VLHLEHIAEDGSVKDVDAFIKKASGRYYTGELVGQRLAREVARAFRHANPDVMSISVLDPFGGDARLVEWLIAAWEEHGYPTVRWHLEIWDRHDHGFKIGRERLHHASSNEQAVTMAFRIVDTFSEACSHTKKFDIVVTNPPWELLKPDRRELERLPIHLRNDYVLKMREYDNWLRCQYPKSQPKQKFAGWGTNLSRVGLEVSLKMTRSGGIVGSVLPASILADDQSGSLRQHLLTEHALLDIAYYPAEAKLYDKADVASVTVVAAVGSPPSTQVSILMHGVGHNKDESVTVNLQGSALEKVDFVLPVSFGAKAIEILTFLSTQFPRWIDLEDDTKAGFWAGREVDETGSNNWLIPLPGGMAPFLKGRMIERYTVREEPTSGVARPGWNPPASLDFPRVVWRDVSRPSQKRRVLATLIPAGWAAGNSLGVAYFKDRNQTALASLLGVMNSTTFEFQLRAHLATGHVSLSSLRKVSVPTAGALRNDIKLAQLVSLAINGDPEAEIATDAYVARRVYHLSDEQYATVLGLFPKLSSSERSLYLDAYRSLGKPDTDPTLIAVTPLSRSSNTETNAMPHASTRRSGKAHPPQGNTHDLADREASTVIFNHVSARLSALDMQMVLAIPEGGNWKDIPDSIPSKRLEQIRESFKRGEGSRSTYYGRLRRDRPSYTINTYFNRPGNGCHVHYSQDRVLSHREAARLQSFPDSFEFLGAQGAICKQIGNAVPPLLAYQIALTLKGPGVFIDLFAGAGGMGLGFKWAGWTPLIANDIEPTYLATYARNVHHNTVVGSITEPEVFEKLVAAGESARAAKVPLWVLGGPPCQGFSTAGNRRSMKDERNHLAWDYVKFLDRVKPDGFVFENVTGLLSMQGGKVFASVREAFSSIMPSISGVVLSADNYAVPQRRKRVILVGMQDETAAWSPPERLTSLDVEPTLFGHTRPAISMEEAVADLPPLQAGENGIAKVYEGLPHTMYQALMRGFISPDEYLAYVTQGVRHWP
jgi:Alw26I/Eco31I/Esp3I family type II restriction m6 adenine DNA methyltransferase